jgi:DegV family protein with EDD domain
MRNGIIVDSACDVSREYIETENCILNFVPLTLQVEDKIFVDDENLSIDDFLAHMEASSIGVKTAAPSPGSFFERFSLADNIFAVTLSNKLSATYQSAVTAKRMYFEEYGKKFIHIFDSLTASVGEGVIAMKIADLLKKGISNTDIIEQVNQFISTSRTYLILDKYDNLVKTGRIKPYVAKIASFLNIKPICASFEGEIKMLDKARGYTKSMKRLVEIIRANTPDIESRIVSIAHVKCVEKALALKDELINQLKIKTVLIQESRGVITTYANRGGLVVAL